MYVKDFGGTGASDQIISVYNHGTSYPIATRDELLKAIPFLKPRYPRHEDYARQTVTDIFSPDELRGAIFKQARTFATTLARNNGDGSFTLIPLPREAQLAPVYGILAGDFNGDGKTDLLLAGNFDGVQPEIGRMSASYGLLLRGDGAGGFAPVPAAQSGFVVRGQARDIQRIRTRRGDLYLVTRNNDRPLLLARLGLDDDHPVRATHAVQRGAGGIFDDLDRLDVVRIDRLEAVGVWQRVAVDDEQRLGARDERSDAADPDGDTAAGRPLRRDHARQTVQQQLLDRSPGHALDVFLGQCGMGDRGCRCGRLRPGGDGIRPVRACGDAGGEQAEESLDVGRAHGWPPGGWVH
jgi:FG-GAP-like repeat